MPSLVVGSTRIELQCLVGPSTKNALQRFLIVLGSNVTWGKQRTLVTVGHHNHRHIVILAALIHTILVVANHVTIHARPETSKAHVTIAQCHGIHGTQLLQILFLQMLHKGHTLLLGTLLRGIKS